MLGADLQIPRRSGAHGDPLDALRSELERFGVAHDSATPDPGSRMLNITRDTGEFLRVLICATRARRVLEIGTSNGYSTLWLAEAVMRIGGMVTTLEADGMKAAMAASNLDRSGIAHFISLQHVDATAYLAGAQPASFDAVFIDSDRARYADWWPSIDDALSPGGLIVVDNATSHPLEVEPLVALVRNDQRYLTSLVQVGKGQFVAVKSLD